MENPPMSPGSRVMGILSASTVPPTPMSLNCAGIRADVMLASLQATLVPAPTNTGGVTKSPANPVETVESTATRARIERTMTVSSFGTWRDGSFQPPRRSVPRNSVPFRHRMPPAAPTTHAQWQPRAGETQGVTLHTRGDGHWRFGDFRHSWAVRRNDRARGSRDASVDGVDRPLRRGRRATRADAA